MQTPTKVTLDGFYLGRNEYLRNDTHTNYETMRVLCRKCGSRIKVLPAKIEIHDAANGQCVGGGESFETGIPYCPHCEEMPAAAGCVHA